LLVFATAQDRAVLTYSIRHFVPLVSLWYEAGWGHAGVILSVQLPPGDLLRQIERLLATLSADTLKNTVRWLQEFDLRVTSLEISSMQCSQCQQDSPPQRRCP
jgi:hypothetical protein